ncbi:MAG: hypothetical protein L3J87_01655 [Thermoplasmata archaeon]|nr:hypothetical protein [Thermoplasmata archaeon]
MLPSRSARTLSWATLTVLLGATAIMLLAPGAASGAGAHATHGAGPSSLSQSTFVSAPPTGATGPDDITYLATAGLDHGRAMIWTNYQNGVNPNGTPGTPGGLTHSTVAGYDRATGTLVRTFNVTGKVDGLTADPWTGTLLATVNEDDNSALAVIYPALGAVASYTYSPNPAVSGNGGTDSLAIRDGVVYVAHSNPNDATQATDYRVTLHQSTLIAQLTPVFYDDSAATNAVTGAATTLALTDPDTNFIMPAASPRFAGTLATVGQADGEIIFASHLSGTPQLKVLPLTDNVSGNVPPIDGLAVATCGDGTLYVVDASANTIVALDTTGWAGGTVFVGEPHDNHNPLVGALNLNTGVITPLSNHFVSPKGLLFVPDFSHCGDADHPAGGDHDHHGEGDGHHGGDGSRRGEGAVRAAIKG